MLLCVALVLAISVLQGTHGQVTVGTKYGVVQGQTNTLHNGISVNSFLAVPYARAPVGDLRFQKPQEPEPWSDVFVADTLGNACKQAPVGLLWITHPGWNKYSEDCLHLNIYTPTDMSGAPYAVMVWFHGGAFQSSANIQYPGYFLAAKDVVVVVANYRLGIFGFGSTGDDVAPGNFGLWDQNLALRFVQENIARFGGDPNRVTIFGQSAGAASTGIHIVSPQSRGLFHNAIYESGSETTLWSLNYPASDHENYIRQVARKANCPEQEESKGIIDCLKALDAEALRTKAGFECTPGHFCQGFAPVVDGPDGMLPKVPSEMRYEGDFAPVPLLAGHTNKDGSLYTIAFIPEALEGGFNRSTFLDIIKNRAVGYFAARVDYDEKIMEDVFQAMNFFYTPWPHIEDKEANRQAFNDIITDVGFGYPSDAVYKKHQEVADVYNYIFGYRSVNAAEVVPEWLGVPHNGEIPYVFGWTLLKKNPAIRAESGMIVDLIDWDETDEVYTEYIQDMWANFAKYGDPTPQPIEAPDGGMTKWAKFTVEELNYLDINNTIEAKVNYNQQNFAFWTEYIPYISGIETLNVQEKKPFRNIPLPDDLRMRSDLIEETTNKLVMDMLQKKFAKP